MAQLSDKELEGLGAQAFNMAKRDMEQGKFNFLLASCHAGEGLHRMARVEALINQRLGKGWMNDERAKDIGFGLIREAVNILPPEAMVFASVINNFTVTERFDKLAKEKQLEIANGGHDKHHQAVRDGYMKVCDALMAAVQTPERICLYRQNIHEDKATSVFFGLGEFDGRLRFFGEKKKRKGAVQ